MPNPYIINPSHYTTMGGGIAATGRREILVSTLSEGRKARCTLYPQNDKKAFADTKYSKK
jgi:hypothetical protein